MLTDGAAELDGLPEGPILTLGILDTLGVPDGRELGESDGSAEGTELGILDGKADGPALVDGGTDGTELGVSEGKILGI